MSRSNYAVSDFLVDRHPANTAPFSGEIDSKQNTTAYGYRAIPKFIELLKAPNLNEKEKLDAIKNVLSLDLAHQETKVYAVQQGLIECMKDLMKDPNGTVRALAIAVLGKLASSRQAQDKMTKEDVVVPLLEALKDSTNVSIAAATTLQKFTSTSRAACTILIQHKAISIYFDKTIEAILLPILEVLAALTAISDDAILGALECEAVPALQKVMNDFPELALQCCCNLAKHMRGKEAMVNANMLPTIAHLLHHQSPSVQRRALTALMLLCIVVSAKQQASQIPQLVDDLVQMSACKDEMKKQYATSTLALIGEHPLGRREIEKCIVKNG